jgi:hypothetical protein
MLAATNCSKEIHDHFEKHHLGIGALPVFCGSCSLSKDWVESKERWTEHPNLFQVQVKLKFGKPGAMSLKRCDHEVASDFDKLMKNNEKKTAGNFATVKHNAILVGFRVQKFHQQTRSIGKKKKEVKKAKDRTEH